MKQDQQVKSLAKQLLKLSMSGGSVSEERVGGVLQALAKNPPRHHALVLRAYLKLVQREIAQSTAFVNHAGQLSAGALERIAADLSARRGRPITAVARQDDSLITGLKIVVDCDVYENSAASALRELQSSLS